MVSSHLNYVPVTLPFFVVLAGVFLLLLVLIQLKALRYPDDCRHVARDQRRPLRRLQLVAVGVAAG